ncbi:MAG TPA: hypothetical protein VFX59_20130 [Polyangiales bacterium]|nr:hypothetical protein [Polyangiales bacterium]
MFDPTRRAAYAAVALAVLLGILLWRDVFASTVVSCQRGASGTRCSVTDTQLGLHRGTLVLADLQGAYVEDEGYDRSAPRLVIQGRGGDIPLAGSSTWTRGRQHEAAAALDHFAEDPTAQALRFEERHAVARALAAIAVFAALVWIAWPKLRPAQAVPADEPRGDAIVDEGNVEPTSVVVAAPRATPWSTRVAGALLLRRVRYRELGEDPAATWPAFAIVALVALIVGYADGLGGSAWIINGEPVAPSVANANLRAVAAAAAACVSWPAAAVLTSWLAAGRGGVRTLELLRALGFANLFHLFSLLKLGALLAWPLFFVASYVAARGVCSAGRLRSLFATWVGQSFALVLAIPLWLAVLSLGSD